jgi:hypothetical protein
MSFCPDKLYWGADRIGRSYTVSRVTRLRIATQPKVFEVNDGTGWSGYNVAPHYKILIDNM